MSGILNFTSAKILLRLFVVWTYLHIPKQGKNFPFAFANAHPDVPFESSLSTSFGDAAWTIFDSDSSLPCIKLEGTISFKVVADPRFGTDIIFVPQDAEATGHCQSLWGDYQDIKLAWVERGILGIKNYSYSIYFGIASAWESEFSNLEINSNEFALNSVTVVVEERSSQDHPISYSVSDFIAFPTPKNRTFTCSTAHFHGGDLLLTISSFRFQAFNINERDFSSTFECNTEDFTRSPWEYITQGMGWIFLGFFALCVLGVILVLLVGGFNQRHDIMAIGYRFVGTSTQSSDA